MSSLYSLTQSYKLQIQILENIGILVRHIEIHEKDLDNILEVVVPVFSTGQPQNVKERAGMLIRHLYDFDSTAVVVKFQHQPELLRSILL